MKELIIGLAGLSFESKNLGCAALAISFYKGMVKLLKTHKINVKIVSFSAVPAKMNALFDSDYPVEFVEYHLSDFRCLLRVYYRIKQCDLIVDFTEGDSFSDIYGMATFVRSIFIKMVAIRKKVDLVLGPQTYGPYSIKMCRRIATYIIEHAKMVCSRDRESKDYLKETGIKKEIKSYTDIAYLLPYKKENNICSDKIKVGINISALLWTSDTVNKERFGLTVEYKNYCKAIINWLLQDGAYKVFLIPHVGAKWDESINDYTVCSEVKTEYKECILLDGFSDPIEAKGVIAQMDVFIGARMHSTIGAFSAGVLTIPFAYSKKFYGYFDQVNYPILIEGRALTTEEAFKKTIMYIQNRMAYRDAQKRSMEKSLALLNKFYEDIYNEIIIEARND